MSLAGLAVLTLIAYRHVGGVPFYYDDAAWWPAGVQHGLGLVLWRLMLRAPNGLAATHELILALHLVNGALVWWLLRHRVSETASTIAVGLFWLHPLQVAAVATLTGGRDVTLATWTLAAIALGLGSRWPWLRWPFVALCLVAAFSVKPSAVVVVALVPLAWALLGRPMRWAGIAVGAAFLMALPALTIWLRSPSVPLSLHALGTQLRWAGLVGWATARDLAFVVWPVGFTFAHGWPRLLATWRPAAGFGVLALALFGVWRLPPRSRVICGAALLWLAVAIGPRAAVVWTQVLTEPHTYLPFLAVWALAGWALAGGQESYV